MDLLKREDRSFLWVALTNSFSLDGIKMERRKNFHFCVFGRATVFPTVFGSPSPDSSADASFLTQAHAGLCSECWSSAFDWVLQLCQSQPALLHFSMSDVLGSHCKHFITSWSSRESSLIYCINFFVSQSSMTLIHVSILGAVAWQFF